MKVTRDVPANIPQAGPRTILRRDAAVSGFPPSRSQIEAQHQNIVISQMARERALSDALSIAQMSFSIIQQAMEVSSRLRNIASRSMTSGTVDMAELQVAISQIPEGVRDSGRSFSAPVQTMPAPIEAPVQDTAADTARLRAIAENMAGGAVPQASEFDYLQKRFSGRAAEIEASISEISGEMGLISGGYGSLVAKNPPGVSLAADSILSRPGQALVSQGNISHEAVNHLLRV
jgi:hypothetical protein